MDVRKHLTAPWFLELFFLLISLIGVVGFIWLFMCHLENAMIAPSKAPVSEGREVSMPVNPAPTYIPAQTYILPPALTSSPFLASSQSANLEASYRLDGQNITTALAEIPAAIISEAIRGKSKGEDISNVVDIALVVLAMMVWLACIFFSKFSNALAERLHGLIKNQKM